MKTQKAFTTERAGKEIRNFYETIKNLLFNGEVVGELFDPVGRFIAKVTAITIEDEVFYALWENELGDGWSLYCIRDFDKIQEKWNDLYDYWHQ